MDPFILDIHFHNAGTAEFTDLMVALQVGGTFWFYPGWTTDIQKSMHILDTGDSVRNILSFQWPNQNINARGLTFWAALFEFGEWDLMAPMDSVTFDCE